MQQQRRATPTRALTANVVQAQPAAASPGSPSQPCKFCAISSWLMSISPCVCARVSGVDESVRCCLQRRWWISKE